MARTHVIYDTVSSMRDYIDNVPKKEKIGFVPTMGYLHEGHLSLVKQSVSANPKTIVSIFVNPTQFGQDEDFNQYPRDIKKDITLLKLLKVDAVFIPDAKEIYPENYLTFVDVQGLSEIYCGKTRPGHFRGVTTVITKLLNIIKPHFMYMGEKDFQQVYILEKMITDLNYDTKIVRCPIIRDEDGLAMSSRNKYLHDAERLNAVSLYQSLLLANQLVGDGVLDISTIKKKMSEVIEKNSGIIDYIAFVNEKTFAAERVITPETRVLLAVRIGKTRLIDNMRIHGNYS